MSTTQHPFRAALAAGMAIALVLCAADGARAQASKSAAAAKELASALDRLKLDSIAAPDPSAPDRFVAALYFPGMQLLVVSAQYSVPSLLTDRIANKDYRDVYIDLNSASVQGTKTFVIDGGANGLVARPDDSEAPDSVERANKTVAFDGDWRAAKLSEQEYMASFAKADEEYARMLSVLSDYANSRGGS